MVDIDLSEVEGKDFEISISESYNLLICINFGWGSVNMSYDQYEKLKESIIKFESQ